MPSRLAACSLVRLGGPNWRMRGLTLSTRGRGAEQTDPGGTWASRGTRSSRSIVGGARLLINHRRSGRGVEAVRMAELPHGGFEVVSEVGQIASGPGTVEQRAEALLETLHRLVP